MLRKMITALIVLVMIVQTVGQPALVFANEPISVEPISEDFSEAGHSADDLDSWDEAGNLADDVTPYHEGEDDPEDDWEGVDEDQMVYEGFNPYYLEPVARMSDAEIASFAGVQIGFDADGNEVPVHQITNAAQLQQFLSGSLGENHHHFVIPPGTNITLNTAAQTNAATTLTTGRPGVFTGVFEGNGATITGLRLRSGRTANNALAAGFAANQDGQVGVGLIQLAGHGAVIRNLNIDSQGASTFAVISSAAVATTQAMALTNTGLAYFTSAHNRNVGGFIGATVQNEPGVESVVTLSNVHITGARARMTLQFRTNSITPAADRTAQGSWGGMVGRVQAGTNLNIIDATIQNMEIHVNGTASGSTALRPTHEVRAIAQAGGMVGSVHGGRLNVTTYNRTVNTVDYDSRAFTRGTSNAAAAQHARYTGINASGGIVGNVHSGHVHIEDTNVTSRRTNFDPIRARHQAGGIIGNMNVQASVRLYNVQNAAQLQINGAGGENSTNGRAGGLIGRALGAVHIENSRNYGVIQGQGNHQTLGGLIGYTGPSSSVVVLGSRNGQLGGGVHADQPTGCTSDQACVGQSAGLIRHVNNHPGSGAGTNNATGAHMGGIIGRSRGRLIIEDTVNHGHINKSLLNTASASRRNTRLGGIVGRLNPVGGQVVTLNNVENFGHIQLGQTRSETIIGGIVAEIMAPPRGQSEITINNAVNRGTVTGGAHSGGIVGWSRARGITITDAENHGLIARNAALTHPQDSGGIVGRAGAADLRIINPTNHANITPGTGTQRGGYHAGGIIGRASGANLYIENAYNTGNVRGHANAAGVVGFADGNDARIKRAVNRGNHHASRNAGHTTAAGIVGRARRRNMQIIEAGNFGNMTMQGGNNVQDGVAGIMGRNDGANGVVQDSFNVGNISGRNTAGGIVGRNSGNLNITNVYNIGYVSNFGRNNAGTIAATTGTQNVRAGSGILGRRTSGNVRITNAFVSARVGGFAVGIHTGGNGVLQANGAVTGITFNNVFVDQNAFYSEGTGFQPNNPASQVNRPGIFLVDTEMLTSGFLPGISGGAWSIGINDVHPDLQRTYPFLTWQAPDGQEQFFDTIRSTNTVADVTAPRPVMDMQVQATTNRPVTFDFGGRSTAGVRHFNNYIHIDRISSGNVPVTGNTLALTRPLTRPAGIVMPPVDNVNRSSIGLISPLGIVGFETREVSGRLVVRGFDPEFGTDANRYYISHARFEVVSDDSVLRDEIRLNEEFRAAPGAPDEMRGMGVIAYVVDENQPLVVDRGLNPRPGGYTGDVASDINDATNPTTLANYTVIRITALGYEPTYRIIRQDDLVALSTGTISVPMERIPFEIRTWVPQTEEFETADSELEVGPPGTAIPGLPPHGAQEGFGVLPNHAPGSHLALDPVLTITTTPHNQTRGGQNVTLDTPTTGGPQGTNGHFAVTTVLWGDELVATGRHHTTYTINELRFTDLFDRGVNTWESADEERVRILDTDMYVTNTGLETIYIRFIELTGTYQELWTGTGDTRELLEANPQFRVLNIDGTGTGLQPNIQLTFHNQPNAVITSMTTPSGVHHPLYAFSNGNNPNNTAIVQNQLMALQNITSAAAPTGITQNFNTMTPHFRVDGLTPEAIFDVIDLGDNFIALEGEALANFMTYFYALTNDEDRMEAGHGELLTFSNVADSGAGNTARNTQINNAINGEGNHSGARASGILNRTIIVPLAPVQFVPVRVVEQLPDGTFQDIGSATLTHNGEQLTRDSVTGEFIFRDTGASNWLQANGGGRFYPHNEFNAHTSDIEGLKCDASEMRLLPENNADAVETWHCTEGRDYIRIVLDPLPLPEYVTVTFDLAGGIPGADGDEDRFDPQTVLRNEVIQRPMPDPVREGYEFQHWVERVFLSCLDEDGEDLDLEDCENPNFDYHLWNFETAVTENTYLVAIWTPMHQVRFVPGANGTLSTSTHISLIRHGETIGEEGFVSGQIPNAGHRFSHWTSDTHEGTFTTEEIRELPITADTIFTGHFVVLQFTVSFNLGDGRPADNAPAGQFDDQLVDWNTTATNPTAGENPHPIHPEGYEFSHWAIRTQTNAPGEYVGDEYIPGPLVYTYLVWDFDTVVTADIELFAVGSNLNRVTFVAGENGIILPEGITLFRRDDENLSAAPEIPSAHPNEGHLFMYWTSNSHTTRVCPIPENAGDDFDFANNTDCDDSVAIIETTRFYSEFEIREAVITEDTIFTAHFEREMLQVLFIMENFSDGEGGYQTRGTYEGTVEWVVPSGDSMSDADVVIPTVIPRQGWEFSHWTSTCHAHEGIFYTIEELLALEVVHHTFITAHFERVEFIIEYEVVGGYPGTLVAHRPDLEGPVVESGSYVHRDDTVVLIATPEEGYYVYQWMINGLPVQQRDDAISLQQWIRLQINPSATPMLTDDILTLTNFNNFTTVTVEFKPMPVVDFEIEGSGTVVAQVVGLGTAVVAEGTKVGFGQDVLFTATPAAGYTLTGWYVNGVRSLTPIVNDTFLLRNVTADTTVRTVFTAIPVEVDFEVVGDGEINGEVVGEGTVIDEDGTIITYGQDIIFTATPEAGFRIAGWYVNGENRTSQATGDAYDSQTLRVNNVTVDTTIRVIFEAITFSLEFSAEPVTGGTILAVVNEGVNQGAVDSGVTVGYRATATFTATPNAGYSIAGWTINGELVADNVTSTFTTPEITEKTVVTVLFARDGHSAILTAENVRVQAPVADEDDFEWLIREANVVATSTLTQAGREPVTTNHANSDDLTFTITDFAGTTATMNAVNGGQYIVTITLPSTATGAEDLTVQIIVTLVGARN